MIVHLPTKSQLLHVSVAYRLNSAAVDRYEHFFRALLNDQKIPVWIFEDRKTIFDRKKEAWLQRTLI